MYYILMRLKSCDSSILIQWYVLVRPLSVVLSHLVGHFWTLVRLLRSGWDCWHAYACHWLVATVSQIMTFFSFQLHNNVSGSGWNQSLKNDHNFSLEVDSFLVVFKDLQFSQNVQFIFFNRPPQNHSRFANFFFLGHKTCAFTGSYHCSNNYGWVSCI